MAETCLSVAELEFQSLQTLPQSIYPLQLPSISNSTLSKVIGFRDFYSDYVQSKIQSSFLIAVLCISFSAKTGQISYEYSEMTLGFLQLIVYASERCLHVFIT